MPFIRKHFLLNAFFLLLGISLFLGDGQQMLIDTVGAGGVLFVVLVAFLYGKRERALPIIPTALWGFAILYCILRTIFSDDIGYSIYATMRLIEAFLIFSVFYVYSSEEDHVLMPFYVLVFSLFSLFTSILYVSIPFLAVTLPKTNLLIPTYGHNNIVDILLFGIPIALYGILLRKKSFYLYVFLFLLLGVVFSFARAAMIIVSLFIVFSLFFYWRRISKKMRMTIGILIISIVGLFSILFFVPQSSYDKYFSKIVLPKITKEVGGANNRFEYWRQALEALKERPLFGSGPGTFLLQSKRLQIAPSSYSRHAHNALLEQLTEVGLVGTAPFVLLFFWVVIRVICVYRKDQREKRFILVTLTSCVILQTLNAFADFSLSYFVVEMLFVSVISIIVSLGSDSKKEVWGWVYTILVMGSLSVVFIFYIFASLCNTGLLKGNIFVSRFCYLSEFTCTESLKKTDEILKDWELDSMLLLHEKNSEILFELAKNELKVKHIQETNKLFWNVIKLDLNSEYLREYISFLLSQKRYYYLFFVVKTIINTVTQDAIRDTLFLEKHWVQIYSCFNKDTLVWNEKNTSIDYHAKSLYYAGLCLAKNSRYDEAKELLRIAANAQGSWSNIYLDYAGLSMRYGDINIARQAMRQCKANENSRKHCSDYDDEAFPHVSVTDQTVVLY